MSNEIFETERVTSAQGDPATGQDAEGGMAPADGGPLFNTPFRPLSEEGEDEPETNEDARDVPVTDSYQDVNAACARWLLSRGYIEDDGFHNGEVEDENLI